MFETYEFRELIDNAIKQESLECGMQSYEQEGILDFLQEKAVSNESEIWNAESKKTASARIDMNAATISSVQKLVKTASARALSQSRTDLRQEDMLQSFWENWCKVWPFCKGQ